MDYHFILAIVIVVLMVALLVTSIVINHKNYQATKEIRESLEAGNSLMDKLVSSIKNNEESRREDFKQHLDVLSLIRKNTNKKDSGQKKDFKKPNDKHKSFQGNQQKPTGNK